MNGRPENLSSKRWQAGRGEIPYGKMMIRQMSTRFIVRSQRSLLSFLSTIGDIMAKGQPHMRALQSDAGITDPRLSCWNEELIDGCLALRHKSWEHVARRLRIAVYLCGSY